MGLFIDGSDVPVQGCPGNIKTGGNVLDTVIGFKKCLQYILLPARKAVLFYETAKGIFLWPGNRSRDSVGSLAPVRVQIQSNADDNKNQQSHDADGQRMAAGKIGNGDGSHHTGSDVVGCPAKTSP